VFAEHRVQNLSGGRQELVIRDFAGIPLTVGDLEHRTQQVRQRLVGAEDAKIALFLVQVGHIAQELAQHECILTVDGAGRRHIHGVSVEIGHLQVAQQNAAVGVRFAPIRRSAFGASSANSGMSRPFSSNSSSAW
jgi:hypothetical protein